MIQKNFSELLVDEEKILLQIDKHPIVLFFSGLYLFVFIVTCGVSLYYRGTIEPILGDGLYWGGLCLFSVIILSFVAFSLLSSLLDTLIVTDSRIISLEQHPPFGQKVDSVNFSEMSEINAEMRGILPTLFGYGKIEIGYQGGNQEIRFGYAPKPNDIVKSIHEIREKKVS